MTMTDTDQPASQDDQPITPEVVEPAKAEPERSPADSALDRAAEYALANPGAQGRDEFLALAATARILSMSGAAPELVRGNPYLAFHIALVGRDLGISPSAALAMVDVIPSKGGPQLSLSPELMNGQIARLGLGQIVPVVRTEERAIAVALAPGGHVDYRCKRGWPTHVEGCECRGIIDETEFTWRDAQVAGLVHKDCNPGAHRSRPTSHQGNWRCGCNQGYLTYPRRMLWWRAAGFCADDNFPSASLGLYSPEELGAAVDEEGRPIDPSTVALPEGYEPKALPPSAPEPPARTEVIEDLRTRIKALWPVEGARAAWIELWRNIKLVDGAETVARDGVEPLPHVDALLERHVKRAVAIVESVEKRIAKGEWGAPTAGEAPGTAEKAPQAPEPATETGTAEQDAPGPENAAEDLDDEDSAAALAVQAAHDEAWSLGLGDVRARLRALSLDDQGKPDDVRRRLEAELARAALVDQVPGLAPATSLMDAVAQDEPPAQ